MLYYIYIVFLFIFLILKILPNYVCTQVILFNKALLILKETLKKGAIENTRKTIES